MKRTVDKLLRHEETLLTGLTENQREQLTTVLRTVLRTVLARLSEVAG